MVHSMLRGLWVSVIWTQVHIIPRVTYVLVKKFLVIFSVIQMNANQFLIAFTVFLGDCFIPLGYQVSAMPLLFYFSHKV
jgi:hypothetical protein